MVLGEHMETLPRSAESVVRLQEFDSFRRGCRCGRYIGLETACLLALLV